MNGRVPALSTDKQMLLALRQLRQRVEELENSSREPIAIVGMACRFPGASSPENYWKLLREKRSAITEVPRWRVDLDRIFAPYPAQAGKTYSRWAGLLDSPEAFDAEFFGIAPREAGAMDPQQRLLLEVSWEALEDAGIDPKSLAGTSAGIFLGISASEYGQRVQRSLPPEELSAYTLQGAALNAAAGRLAYFYGCSGPAIAIDTACSSSLVAVDRACRSLREGESTLALAAGVNLIASAEGFIIASQWGMLSGRGVCAAFEEGADGFVRGEGSGVVVLKRLREAEAAGDRIRGVILGTAVNQDGASSGLTVPNGLAQQALLREAHLRAGIEAGEVGYVEAHGTGTRLGDPIEAEALGAVFGGRKGKLGIGSVKGNIGHLEAAAGIAGLMKVVLSLEHEEIPGQAHWERPSEHVRWEELGLEVEAERRRWEPIGGRRIGGVSSFGFSGTNAHVVVEGRSRERGEGEEERTEVLVISARTEAALRELASRYAEELEEEGEWSWGEICHTAGVGRAGLSERLAVVAGSRGEAAGKLREWLGAGRAEGVWKGHAGAGQRRAGEASGTAEQIAEQYVHGGKVNWAERAEGRHLRRARLPGYAFQRERYWIEERREAGGEATGRGMLGRRLAVAGMRAQYETRVSAVGWAGEHVVEGRVILPAAGHIELMLEAGAETLGSGCVVEEVVLQAGLEVEGERRVQVAVEEERGGRSRVRIYGERGEGEWERVSEGWVSRRGAERPERVEVRGLERGLEEREGGEKFYGELRRRGLEFGERFRGVRRLWGGEGRGLGEIAAAGETKGKWELWPWALDACLQVAAAAGEPEALYLPASLERCEVFGEPAERMWSHVATRSLDDRTLVVDIAIFHPDGSPHARLSALRFRKPERDTAGTEICRTEWKQFEPRNRMNLEGSWLVLCDREKSALRIASDIRTAGGSCSIVAETSLRGDSSSPDEAETAFERTLREKLRDSSWQGVVDLRLMENAEILRNAVDPEHAIRATARVLQVLKILVTESIRPASGFWLVTRGAAGPGAASPAGAAAWALARTASAEFSDLRVRCIDTGEREFTGEIISSVGASGAIAILVRGECFLQPELVRQRDPNAETDNFSLKASQSGLIDLLQEVPTARRKPLADEVEIRIEAHGINFRDLLTALAMLPGGGRALGGECAGTVLRAGPQSRFHAGDRVFAFAPSSLQGFVTVPAVNVAAIPEGMTTEQAAALPIAYLTALYGLDRLAALRSGETILIHAGAGGLGMAAVHLALARGAVVCATAGSDQKREYLARLGVRHVFSSRTGDFADGILQATGGRGVDVILNSLTGDLAEKNLIALAPGGRLLEVGKRDTMSRGEVRRRRPDVAYFIYDLGEEAERDASLIPALLAELLRMLGEGSVAPLPVTTFSDVRAALRYMAQARHIGKIVVARSRYGHTKMPVSADATYLITGGCGGLGMIMAESLVERGARGILLMGRSAPCIETMERIGQLRARGAEVTVLPGDVADLSAINAALAAIPKERPVKGILHLAGVLADRSLLLQDRESLLAAMRPKWLGAWNLHLATENLPLDFFTLFSSAVVSLGSPGQANYAAANATLDALAVWRRSRGLPALSVQWGPWAANGMAEHLTADLESCGLGRLAPAEGMDALDRLLSSEEPVAAVLPVTSWDRLRRWRVTADRSAAAQTASGSATTAEQPARDIVDRLRAMSPGDRYRLLGEQVRQQVIHILSLPESTRIDEDEALHDLGLDSLMAVELRNALAASLGQPWSPTVALDYPTLRLLTEYLLREMFGELQESQPRGQQIGDLSEAEAEQQLLQELAGGRHDADR